MRVSAKLASIGLVPLAAGVYVWPDKYDYLEDLVAINGGYLRFGLSDLIVPCGFGSNREGIQNSAEWLRTAFHDMATYDASTGTGGLDASLMFEMDRAENTGDAFNNTFNAISEFVNVRASAADVLALAAVISVASCGGPNVPLRFGRIDATGPGPAGVPKPEDDLQSTTERFAGAGFSQADMITMVACGHTLGNIHSVDFPDMVSGNASEANVAAFDKTPSSFDNAVVTEYLSDTTTNPLVAGANDTTNSDKRIFSADGNKTMSALADKDLFKAKCGDIFERMLNTVPATVTLSEPLELRDIKPYFDSIQLQTDGKILAVGRIRVRTTKSTGRDPDDLSLALPYIDRSGQRSVQPINTTMAHLKGGQSSGFNGELFNWYEFSQAINGSAGISAFNVSVTSLSNGSTVTYDNGGTGGYPIQPEILYQKTASCLSQVGDGFNLSVTVAVRKERVEAGAVVKLDVVRRVARPFLKTPDLVPDSIPLAQVAGLERSGYVYFQGNTILAGVSWSTTFDVVVEDASGTYKVEFQKTLPLTSTCGALS